MAETKGFWDTVTDYYDKWTAAPKEETKPTAKKARRPALRPGPGGGSISFRQQVPRELIPEQVFNDLMKRETPGLTEQRLGLKDLQGQLALLKHTAASAPQKTDLSNLLNVSDNLFGSNYLKGYKAPASREERLEKLLEYEALLQEGRKGLTKSEIDFVKSQFYPMSSMGGSISVPKPGGGSGSGGRKKTLPASQAAQIADMEEQAAGVDSFKELWDSYNKPSGNLWDVIAGKAKAFLPLTDENEYMALLHQRATALGKAIEGRMTDADYERYKKNFLPLPGDSETKAQQKVRALKKYVTNKIAHRKKAFTEYGYDPGTSAKPKFTPYVSRNSGAKKKAAPTKKSTMTPQQRQRLDELRKKRGN